MSSRGARRGIATGLGLVWAVGTLTGCAAGAAAPDAAPSRTPAVAAVAADATTRAIAEVEFRRQCTIGSTSFADEADITADLDRQLAAAGLTHLQWKNWHDALDGSPGLVDQLAEVGAGGCAAG